MIMNNTENPFFVDGEKASKDKSYYALAMFPYPSGAGLHVGHVSNFVINDIVARYKRMQWFDVLNPIGFDSFGLPTENYAMKVGKPAYQVTKENIDNFIKQLQLIDNSYDRDKMLTTSDKDYYKRTQRLFRKLYEHGLVYRDVSVVNRCPTCHTVLANAQVEDGKCERCDTEIVQKEHPQWFIKITDYADRLIDDLAEIDRPEETKTMQKNWIGRSEGAHVNFSCNDKTITVFTTRPDTLYGVTAIVLAPENTLLDEQLSDDHKEQLELYRKTTGAKTAVQRQQDEKEKTGQFSGLYAKHPLTGEETPIWYADYVLMGYGTGAVMMVPGHDQRDREFAHKHGIAIKQVIDPLFLTHNEWSLHPADLVERQRAMVILKHPTDGTYACLTVKKNGSQTLIGGWVEAGESFEDAAVREIAEETWLVDVRLVQKLNGTVHRQYFSWARQKHVHATQQCFVYQLVSREKATNQTEEELFELQRLPKNTVLWFLQTKQDNGTSRFWKQYLGEIQAITGYGISVNSEKYDGQLSLLTKREIVARLEEQKAGHLQTTYKLRDWSVSRQRYRGSPIPFYYTYKNNTKVPYFLLDQWARKLREWESITPRQTICAILRNPSNGKIAWLERKNISESTHTFVLWWVDDNENPIDAAKREIAEETGYTNVKYVEEIGDWYQARFYHEPKKRNQHNITRTFLFDLVDETSIWLSQEEQAKHTVHWINPEELLDYDEPIEKFIINQRLGNNPTPPDTIDKYNAYNPHPDTSQRVEHLIPEEELPVELPLDIENYELTGKSPLETHPTFPYYTAPDGTTYRRECDTLDTFMCSSFYFLRFVDAHNDNELARKELLDKFFPIDFYIGGKEHTVGHLLYARFIHKFLSDHWYVSSSEPFHKLVHQGMIHAEDGRKMSKRRGNIITPEEIEQKYNTDTLRTYEMFMKPVHADSARDDGAANGVYKFLNKVEKMTDFLVETTDKQATIDSLLHTTIKWVTDDLEQLKLNTSVSKMMVFVNEIYALKQITKAAFIDFVKLLAPYATRLTQQLREQLEQTWSVHHASWPAVDQSKIIATGVKLPVQINGKMRGTIDVDPAITQDEVMSMLDNHDKFSTYISGMSIKKIIFVPGKIINIIVG